MSKAGQGQQENIKLTFEAIPITTMTLPWYWKQSAMSMIPSLVFFSDDLLVDILSLLSVKSLLRFRCVWNALISDPFFAKFHLRRSKSQNQLFTLVTHHIKTIKGESPYGSDDESETDYGIIPYSIPHLLDNPSFTLITDPRSLLNEKDCSGIAGSFNGLICLTGYRLVH